MRVFNVRIIKQEGHALRPYTVTIGKNCIIIMCTDCFEFLNVWKSKPTSISVSSQQITCCVVRMELILCIRVCCRALLCGACVELLRP
jgi:hypothetical protein